MKVFNLCVMSFNSVMALINIIAGDVQYATFFMVLAAVNAITATRSDK